MTGSDPSPRPTLIRVAALATASLAFAAAVTGVAARASVLAWAVATMAVIIFSASYHLKH